MLFVLVVLHNIKPRHSLISDIGLHFKAPEFTTIGA